MDQLLAAYDEKAEIQDDAEQQGDGGSTPNEFPTLPQGPLLTEMLKSINPAPQVPRMGSKDLIYHDPKQKNVHYNPEFESLWEPVVGPANPFRKDGLAAGEKNTLTGFVEDYNLNGFVFDEQYNTFHNFGYAQDPGGPLLDVYGRERVVANPKKSLMMETAGSTVYNGNLKVEKKRKLPFGDAASEDFLGPWAPYVEEAEAKKVPVELTEEQKEYLESKKKDKKKEQEKFEEKTIFHGDSEKDYQGRTYIYPPSELKSAPHTENYIPKRLIHTWTGHTAGVNAIRLFPKYGHLLLSASNDTKVKIWDTYNSRKCLRTFMGHSKAVRDICFTNDGRQFLSAGYDRYLKLWDTETGKVLGSFSNGKVPFCAKFNPDDDKQNEFLVGCSDKKIIQWDIKSNQIVQEYDQHLGAVNTVTFIDENRRFVSSSDDKSLRVWEWGIPVVIKYISEPHMHSMPAVEVHPNGKWFACQSLDNQILIYSTRERFKLNKKKRFIGHLVAGYACQLGFSPDGRFVMSGDGDGKVWFWDWKTSKVFRTLKCHDGVALGCVWHPIETSKVATCGWDGTIKYWD